MTACSQYKSICSTLQNRPKRFSGTTFDAECHRCIRYDIWSHLTSQEKKLSINCRKNGWRWRCKRGWHCVQRLCEKPHAKLSWLFGYFIFNYVVYNWVSPVL